MFFRKCVCDGQAHEVTVLLDIFFPAAVNESSQTVLIEKDENGIYCGRGEEGKQPAPVMTAHDWAGTTAATDQHM